MNAAFTLFHMVEVDAVAGGEHLRSRNKFAVATPLVQLAK